MRLERSVSLVAALAWMGASGCVLPDFEQVGAADAGASASSAETSADAGSDAGPERGPGCGLSAELPEACDACIREHCCDLAEACGEGTDCGEDLLEPIAPTSDFSEDFDELLACMQRECDAACEVTWGCVDDYSWPLPDDDLSFDVRVIDFAAAPDKPLPDITVRACQAVDPACESGLVDMGVTGDDGMVALTVQNDFSGFFAFEGGGYTAATVRWSEPIYRIADWTQYQLTSAAVDVLAQVTGYHGPDDSFDPAVGHMIFRVQGCLPVRYLDNAGEPHAEAGRVSVSFEPNDGASQVFYTDKNGSLSLTLEETSDDGVGGAFSVPARILTVVAEDAASGREVARGNVRVQAGEIGFVYMLPRSR